MTFFGYRKIDGIKSILFCLFVCFYSFCFCLCINDYYVDFANVIFISNVKEKKPLNWKGKTLTIWAHFSSVSFHAATRTASVGIETLFCLVTLSTNMLTVYTIVSNIASYSWLKENNWSYLVAQLLLSVYKSQLKQILHKFHGRKNDEKWCSRTNCVFSSSNIENYI